MLVAGLTSIAGCVDSGAPPAAAPDLAAATGTTDELEWDGHIGTAVAVCPAGILCLGQGGAVTNAWANSIPITGATAINLTMEWTGNEANGGRLAYGLATYCDGPCDFVDYTSGTSPLHLAITDLDPAVEYILVAWHPGSQQGPVYIQYGTDTDFHVHGAITVA